ncbi:hypothetical protein J4Q44_G00221970 [Coregonus suidteri]|uniref:Rab-GAP TBC domain-containing protein n=1 Tax=Coregonus suidteri TaxID=861788 RepID=A0AAN8LD83_9TELE
MGKSEYPSLQRVVQVSVYTQLVFEKEGVYLHTNAKRSNEDTTITWFIRIVEHQTHRPLDHIQDPYELTTCASGGGHCHKRDVSGTDRHNAFFSGNDNPGLTLLNDVLMTYCMFNFDLGYVQWMSDLLAPLLFVTQNEHQNFEESQEAMKQQLLQLSLLLKALNPELLDYLNKQ